MPPLTEQAHDIIRRTIRAGDTAIDATAGNGHDTTFLARLVGPTGAVFALDVQSAALDRTRERLDAAGLTNVTLLHHDHAEMNAIIPERHHGQIAAVMFNLGYLPGGDAIVTTRGDRTVTAITAALKLLRPQGVLTVIAYVGHAGGLDEAAAVERLLRELKPSDFTVRLPDAGSVTATSPRMFAVMRMSLRGLKPKGTDSIPHAVSDVTHFGV